jgi:hypothetical protein
MAIAVKSAFSSVRPSSFWAWKRLLFIKKTDAYGSMGKSEGRVVGFLRPVNSGGLWVENF